MSQASTYWDQHGDRIEAKLAEQEAKRAELVEQAVRLHDIVGGKVDIINHPPHYTKHPSGVECIEITEHMGFCLGNAVKYIWRADMKGGVEDLKKAIWYLQREINKREGTHRGIE